MTIGKAGDMQLTVTKGVDQGNGHGPLLSRRRYDVWHPCQSKRRQGVHAAERENDKDVLDHVVFRDGDNDLRVSKREGRHRATYEEDSAEERSDVNEEGFFLCAIGLKQSAQSRWAIDTLTAKQKVKMKTKAQAYRGIVWY